MSEKKPAARREIRVAIAYPPSVNLLPPEVGQRKAAARARGRAIFVALIAVGVAVLVAAGANVYSLQRQAALDDARARTLSLTADQGEYNDVRTANQLLISTEAARVFAYSTEVSIKGLIDSINSKLSSGMAITDYGFDTANPLQVFAPSVSPLDAESMASFSLEVTAGSVAEIDAWVRKLRSVDGVVQASLESTQSEEGSSFTASVMVRVDETALLHRFDGVVDEAEPAADEAEPAPTNSPEPTSGTDDEENGS